MNLLGSFDMFVANCDDAGIIISLFFFFFFFFSNTLVTLNTTCLWHSCNLLHLCYAPSYTFVTPSLYFLLHFCCLHCYTLICCTCHSCYIIVSSFTLVTLLITFLLCILWHFVHFAFWHFICPHLNLDMYNKMFLALKHNSGSLS